MTPPEKAEAAFKRIHLGDHGASGQRGEMLPLTTKIAYHVL
jgi:hypothetical protein